MIDREVLASALLWSGLLLLVIAPIRRSRRLALAAVASLGVALAIPPRLHQVDTARSALDGIAPLYQFHEKHRIVIPSSLASVDKAIREVTAAEIWLFQTLTAIRRFGQTGPESILHAPEHKPLLSVATGTTFTLLADIPQREIVFGTLVVTPQKQPRMAPDGYTALATPGFAKATMNFESSVQGDGTLLATETRVHATDPWTARRFAVYWRIIFPGSALIRYQWLLAISRRAATE